ncbi:MAG: MvaI/BcnI family restriction endonuclease [Candidatus Njordarchaeales archaeon]
MRLTEIQRKLNHLKEKGFIPSLRRGPTGIGYTLEKELGLKESNIAIPDIGGRVELKTSRRNASSLITLFTFNRGVWRIPQKKLVKSYGYYDENGRRALYTTIWQGRENSLGLSINLDETNNRINLTHRSSNVPIAVWNVYMLIGKFTSKFASLIFVLADSRVDKNNREKFHFNEAYLLEEPTPESFIKAFKSLEIGIDIRMHLRPDDSVRNHGTGFRIQEKDMPMFFGKRRRLI